MGGREKGEAANCSQPENFLTPTLANEGRCLSPSESVSALHRIENIRPKDFSDRIKAYGEKRRNTPKGADWNVYVLIADSDSDIYYFKIGVSNCIQSRICQISTGCPLPIVKVLYKGGFLKRQAFRIESALHKVLKPHHARREWFRFDAEDMEAKRAFSEACAQAMQPYMPIGESFKWETWNESFLTFMMDEARARMAKAHNAEKARLRKAALSNPYLERVYDRLRRA